jgi:hypothetical protein
MTVALRLVVVLALFAQVGVAQVAKEVTTTIHEPGTYELAKLFKQADRVVLAKVVAGDTEAYDVAIYKAEVVKSFKGGPAGETLYFGPFLGERLGSEYILFLRDVPKPITPKTTSSTGYGSIQYSEVFNEGYTAMQTSYECVFDGKDTAQKCDYGVRVCTDYIKLPKSIPAFPPEGNDPPFCCRWVRKAVFVSLLDGLAAAKK